MGEVVSLDFPVSDKEALRRSLHDLSIGAKKGKVKFVVGSCILDDGAVSFIRQGEITNAGSLVKLIGTLQWHMQILSQILDDSLIQDMELYGTSNNPDDTEPEKA